LFVLSLLSQAGFPTSFCLLVCSFPLSPPLKHPPLPDDPHSHYLSGLVSSALAFSACYPRIISPQMCSYCRFFSCALTMLFSLVTHRTAALSSLDLRLTLLFFVSSQSCDLSFFSWPSSTSYGSPRFVCRLFNALLLPVIGLEAKVERAPFPLCTPPMGLKMPFIDVVSGPPPF